jgi:hypothetical protein
MTSLAANLARPDDLNFLLFVHVLGAMLLVGSLLLTATVFTGALVTRVFAQILADEPDYKPFEESTWMEIGFITTEPGLLLIVGAVVASGVGLRRARREGGPVGTSGRVAAVLAWLMVLAYVGTIWAMTAKPV